MAKITEKDYFLPEIFALSGDTLFPYGTTQPMLIRGVCKKTGAKDDYVVKFKGSPRMSPISSCSELIASIIAMELDLYVPDPVLVEISPDFIETIRGKDGYKNASNSIGINFGCKYITGLMELTNRQRLTDGQYNHAVQIFPFDIFISNADRRIEKPNMLTDGEKFLLYDHELAFGFIMDIIKNPTPWIITDSEESWIRSHYFYPYLQKSEHNFNTFVDKLSIINDYFWERLLLVIPHEWRGGHIERIRDNLSLLVINREHFLNEIRRILS
jgi:hypothetical protein